MMSTREKTELTATYYRLKSRQSYRALLEPIRVQVSAVRTQEVLVWASAAWAIDDQGKIYHQNQLSDMTRWVLVDPDRLEDDLYQHLLTGIEAINNFYPPPSIH